MHAEATEQLHSEAAQVSGEPGGQEVGSAFPGRQHKAGLKNILPFRNLFIILKSAAQTGRPAAPHPRRLPRKAGKGGTGRQISRLGAKGFVPCWAKEGGKRLCQLFRRSVEETQLWDVRAAGVGSSRVPSRIRAELLSQNPAAPLTLQTLRFSSEIPQTLEQRPRSVF